MKVIEPHLAYEVTQLEDVGFLVGTVTLCSDGLKVRPWAMFCTRLEAQQYINTRRADTRDNLQIFQISER